ncbi:MAG: hypothetical protein IKN24_04320 [Lachnospiraceae bacterium]|nr:hypothetical protein [Lachnospiraceae bacterium]
METIINYYSTIKALPHWKASFPWGWAFDNVIKKILREGRGCIIYTSSVTANGKKRVRSQPSKKTAALLMAIAMAVSGCAISEPGQDDRETSAAVISEDNRVIKKEEIKTIDSGREDKLKKRI